MRRIFRSVYGKFKFIIGLYLLVKIKIRFIVEIYLVLKTGFN